MFIVGYLKIDNFIKTLIFTCHVYGLLEKSGEFDSNKSYKIQP